MATAYPVYSHPTAPGYAQFLDADTCKIGSIEAAGTLKLAPLTLGSVPFIGASGLVSQDNANFFWDNTNKRLGLRTAAPTASLHVAYNADFLAKLGTGLAFTSTTDIQAYVGSSGWGYTGSAWTRTASSAAVMFGTGTNAGAFEVWTAATGDAQSTAPTNSYSRFFVGNNGYIGAGTTTPGTHDLLLYKNPGSPRDVGIWVTNANTAGGNYASVGVGQADTGSVYGYLIWTSSGSGSTNYLSASSTALAGTAVGGLNLAASHASGNITFYTGSSDNANRRMIIDSTGKVGIGTSSPQVRLDVGDGTAGGGGIKTTGTFPAITSANSLIIDYDAAGTTGRVMALGATGSADGNLSFITTRSDRTNWNTRLYIQGSDGKIGIGTSSPGATLNILDNVTNPGIRLQSTLNGTSDITGALTFYQSSTNLWAITKRAAGYTGQGNNLDFGYYDGSWHSGLMVLTTAGSVGIGTASPAVQLHVRGTNPHPTAEITASDQKAAWCASDESAGIQGQFGFAGSTYSDAVRADRVYVAAAAKDFVVTGSGGLRFIAKADGKVGIGCTDPEAALEVRSSSVPVIQGTRTSSSTNLCLAALHAVHRTTADMVDGFGAGLGFAIRDSAVDLTLIASIQAIRAGADNTGDLTFSTCAAGSESTKVWIKSTGRVGVGTADPNQELEVVGTIRASTISNADNILFQGFNYASGGTRIEVARISEGSTAGAGGLAFAGTRTGSGGNGVYFSSYNPSGGSAAFEYRAYGGTLDSPAAWPSGPKVAVFSKWNGSSVDPLVTIDNEGKVGIGLDTPTALLHLKAGTTAASTAPLKLTSGDLMTAPEAGAIEFLSDKFYGTITTGTVRSAFVFETRTISTGTGLSGGGDLSANRTLTLDQAVAPTWTGAHTFTGGVTFKNHSAFAGSGFIPETRAIQTTTVTPAVLWSKTLADDTLYWVEVRVIGRDTAGVERAYYGRTFYVYRQNPGGATLGNVIELFSEETDADWDVSVNVNTNDVEVKVTGKGSVTINWAGTVTMQAVSGNA